jgi:ArsR family transcriptional regulator, nickel/cobalt-responsive transcriptional repressor
MSKKKGMKDSSIEHTSKMLKAMADLDRLKIINYLRAGTKNVGELANLLNAEIVNVSHHLGVLRDAKLVSTKKQGRFVYYSLNPETCKTSGGTEAFHLGFCRLEIR